MSDFAQELIMWVLGIVGTLVTTILIPFLASWLKSKTDNENWTYVINELTSTVSTSVNYIQQTMVNQMKADGDFDTENQKKALQAAVSTCIDSLTDKAKTILGKDGIDLESLIIKYIESKVLENKANVIAIAANTSTVSDTEDTETDTSTDE